MKPNEFVRFVIYPRPAHGDWAFYYLVKRGANWHKVKPINLQFETEPYDNSMGLDEPMFVMSHEELTTFLPALEEQLIRNNLKPDPRLVEGELRATKVHLEDMRTMTFKTIDAVLAPPFMIKTPVVNSKEIYE